MSNRLWSLKYRAIRQVCQDPLRARSGLDGENQCAPNAARVRHHEATGRNGSPIALSQWPNAASYLHRTPHVIWILNHLRP